jgi:hypothetical protein
MAQATGGLGGVGRAPDVQVGNQAQAGGMFHALVRGAVLAQADAVVREDVDDARFISAAMRIALRL